MRGTPDDVLIESSPALQHRDGMKTIILSVLCLLPLAACGGGGEPDCVVDETYDPVIDPARFVDGVDNPRFPLVPGTTWIYTKPGGDERVETTVTAERRTILGISAVVVHDQAIVADEVIEDTFDWYAQDVDGNVWYMGEQTAELENGTVVSTHGSWEAGVNDAKPGIVMPAVPTAGTPAYRQEYAPCEAEDMGQVLATDASATVPAGSFTACVKTHDFTPLEPALNEEKYYCAGTGVVLVVDVTTGEREELVSVTN
jgi:hypothetical protein